MPFDSCAHAAVERIDGRTVLKSVRSAPPLSLRQTAAGLQIAGSAFGPLGGDHTRLSIEVGPCAQLVVGSVAAAVAQPGPDHIRSHSAVDLWVGAGARLRYAPEPLVIASGAEHQLELTADVAGSGRALLVETIVFSSGPGPLGRYLSRWRVRYNGVPLLSSDLDVGSGAPLGWDGPAVIGEARVIVSALFVNGAGVIAGGSGGSMALPRAVEGAEVMRLAGPGVLVSWLGDDTVAAARLVAASGSGDADDRDGT